jgi:hypothetical protein
MSLRNLACLAAGAGCALVIACSTVADPGLALNGTYILDRSTGNGPASGTLILTSRGYAERRVRYREGNGGMSEEYLARGTAQLKADSTIELELREMNLTSGEPWTPRAKLTPAGVEMSYPDLIDGSAIVETYRRP